MGEVRRSLRRVFAREIDRARAWAAVLRRWRRGWAVRPGTPGRRGMAEGSAPPPGPGSRLRSQGPSRSRPTFRRPARTGCDFPPARPTAIRKRTDRPRPQPLRRLAAALGWTALSLSAHAALLALLVVVFRAERVPPPGDLRETTILIRLPLRPLGPRRPEPPPPRRTEPAPVPPAPRTGTPRKDPKALPEVADPAPEVGTATPPTPAPPSRQPVAPPLPLPMGPVGVGPGARVASAAGVTEAEGSFRSRGSGKAWALGRYGGGPETEDAVQRGLRWLLQHQDEDGGWSLEGYQRHCGRGAPCPGRGIADFDVGATALAALALLGAGHLPPRSSSAAPSAPPQRPARGGAPPPAAGAGSPEPGPFASAVARALSYLLRHQDDSGGFGVVGENYMYNHALATFAVSEALALTGEPIYRDSAEKAVLFTVLAQQAGGGWDYTSRSTGRNDLSITGWQVMALRAAIQAGVEVPEAAMERIRGFLQVSVTHSGEGIYANLGQERGRRGINMVAVGLLSKLYLGSAPAEAPVRSAVDRLLRAPPDPVAFEDWDNTFQSYYYWYTATLALFHLAGNEWRAWNVLLLRRLLPLQSRKGHEEGSWPPELSWVGVSGGRIYATAINVLTLETYYRYEPIHERSRN